MKTRPAILLDQHNALFLLFQRQAKYERGALKRLIWARESRLLKEYETSLLQQYDEVLAVTDNDRDVLLGLLETNKDQKKCATVTTVPICVDPDKQPLIRQSNSAPVIIHLGTMFWPPNIEGVMWFTGQVLPRIVDSFPDIKFIVAGKNPPEEIKELGSKYAPFGRNIEVTGFVPDPNPLLAMSEVFIVPLLAGGGMRVKILDAWLWGIPIVSTRIGAEGIQYREGENILIADDSAEYAEAVIGILNNPKLAGTLRRNGREWVEAHYDWRKEYTKTDAVYQRMARICRQEELTNSV
jgi:glycosyltransferase involved in cell wall biosynthesis